jgi:hypothetical protein
VKPLKAILVEMSEKDVPNPLYTGEKPHQAHLDSGWVFHKKAESFKSEQHLPISSLKSDQKHLSSGPKKKLLFDRAPDIFVMKSGGEHHIVDGNHRIAAAKQKGETHVKATVVDMDAFNKHRNK